MTDPTPVYLNLASLRRATTMHAALTRALDDDPAALRVALRELPPADRDRLQLACDRVAAAVDEVNEEAKMETTGGAP